MATWPLTSDCATRPARLLDYFPAGITGDGVFAKLQISGWPENMLAELDMAYFGTHSGYKKPSLLVRSLSADRETPELMESERVRLADIATMTYARQWRVLYKSLAELVDMQNPLGDIDYTSSTVGTENVTETHTGDIQHSGNDITSNSGSDKEIHTGIDHHRETPSGQDTKTITGTKTNTETHSGSDSDIRTGSVHEKDAGPETTYTYQFDTPSTSEEGNKTQRVGHDYDHDTQYQNVTTETKHGMVITGVDSYDGYTEKMTRGQKTDREDEHGHTIEFTKGATQQTTYGKKVANDLRDTKDGDTSETKTVSGYRFGSPAQALVNYMKSAKWVDFTARLFEDMDQILTISIY